MEIRNIVARLLDLPMLIEGAEEVVLQANMSLIDAKTMLQEKEDGLLLGGIIDGKNAEIRAAQVREYTKNEREALTDAEMNLKNAVTRLGKFRDEFKALQAVSALLSIREVA